MAFQTTGGNCHRGTCVSNTRDEHREHFPMDIIASLIMSQVKNSLNKNIMKNKDVVISLIASTFCLMPFFGNAQDRENMSRNEISRMDSLELVTSKAEQVQKSDDESRLAEAKLDRKQTRAKSKDAKRVEKDASVAARESRNALRAEKKAQKSRKAATRQSKKASDARERSDRN
jgi:hypothetical protein